MANSLWSSELEHLIEIPNLEKYEFIKLGTYGARCYAQHRNYESKHFDDIINKNMSYDELLKSGDYIYNGDATSLYPASMAGFELCEVKYPIGDSRWSDNGQDEYDNEKVGYYNIEFKCPKNIRSYFTKKN